MRSVPARRRRRQEPWWAGLSTEELLDVRFCDLDLRIEGTALEERLRRLDDELERAGLRFRPYVWLSTDWFTPEGSTGFAVPFYLAHRRLVQLEHSQMLQAEGSTNDQCMKLLRHETGHAIDNAYRLHRRKDWRQTFGRYSEPYRYDYLVRPSSREFVQNLGFWYAQSHPAEDYAETFAVWLGHHGRWQRQYEGWAALAKLEALDDILQDVAEKRPLRTRDRVDSLPRLRTTLREHYRKKKLLYGGQEPWSHDRELGWLFRPRTGAADAPRAATFLRRSQQELVAKVAALTGLHRYVVDQALDTMITRCRELDLRMARSRAHTRLGAAVLLTMVTLALSHGRGRFRR